MSRRTRIEKHIKQLQNDLPLIETMSLRKFTKMTGLLPTTVSKVKRGDDVSLGVLKKVLPYMKVCPCCKLPMK